MTNPADKLVDAVSAVDWNGNVAAFVADKTAVEKLASASLRIAIWSRQLEACDNNNPALSFIREMQVANQSVSALIALALYKAAAAGMRATVESALYYTYFRGHPVELATLVRDPTYHVSKTSIVEYHKQHTVGFKDKQAKLGLIDRLEAWYSQISAIIHGQLPGVWVLHTALKDTAHVDETSTEAVEMFVAAADIVHRLFLATVAAELWNGFSTPAKGKLLAGFPGDVKAVLALDKA